MKLIVCLDERGGMEFNKRRQSRDSRLIEDMLMLTEPSVLYISEYSKLLFPDNERVTVTDDTTFFMKESAEDYYFMEKKLPDLKSYPISELIIYHWNRHYPSDVWFDLDLSLFELCEIKDFEGSSHEKITREVFKKK
ncbi:MAG: ribonuclease Z [Clostridia bacterium]|nr:ribonuclease Z [Clostridia bacterium]